MINVKEQEKKIGAGIKTISIINLVFQGLGLIASIFAFIFKDNISSTLQQVGTKTTVSSNSYIIAILIEVLLIISVILILLKNSIGVISYFILYIGNTIYSIVLTGFKPITLVGLILPVLMGIFIYQKRTIFKLNINKYENES